MMNPAQFIAQVRSEAAKVVWPTRKEAGLTTMMVFVLALLAAIFFFIVDLILRFGIDQILTARCPPHLHEAYVKDARYYVELAERASGPLPRGVEPGYVWGDALGWLEAFAPDRSGAVRYRCRGCGRAFAYRADLPDPDCPYCDSRSLRTVDST